MTDTVRTDAENLDFLADLIAKARRAGADAADALLVGGRSLSVACRLGKIERLERSEGNDLGLRVFVGRRQAVVSSSDRAPRTIEALVERAVAMARAAPEDEFAGIAAPEQVATAIPDLDLCDWTEPSPDLVMERARTAEAAARAVPGVTNSEGGEAGWGITRVLLAASNGFTGGYARSGHSVSATAVAGTGTGMERDYDYSSRVHGADLDDPETIGRNAGERAVRRLNARKMPTDRVPVVFEQRLAGGLLRHLTGAINGAAIARGTSFLKNKLGEAIFPAGITIVDDPLQRRGLASKPFDGEGLPTRRMELISKGALQTWVLDLHAARQLGLQSTGSAARGTSSPPSPSTSNVYLEPGTISRDDLIREVGRGFLVTELIGMGVNMLTGDYSRGAAGFWIENGEIAYPVSELTIAGNLNDMFRNLTAADDLVLQSAVNAPTLRVDGLTVAGR
jgi:PmbA protein